MLPLEKKVFAFLEKKKKVSVWELLYFLDANEKELSDVLNEFYKKKIISVSKDGKISLRKKIKLSLPEICDCCNGRLFRKTKKFKEVLRRYLGLTKNYFPDADRWQQARILPEEAVAKAFFIKYNADADFAKICCLGDDDFLSILLALISKRSKITVLDIDKHIINILNKIAKKENLPIKAYRYDVRDKLPKKFIGKFDTVVTDPPEAKKAMLTFLNRALLFMKGKNSSLYFGITHQESSLKKWNLFQNFLLKNNLAITNALRGFCSYPDYGGKWSEHWKEFEFVKKLKFKINKPDCCWYRATLFRLTAFKKPKVANKKVSKRDVNFYRDEETLTETTEMFL